MARTVKHPDVRRSELIGCAQKLFYRKGYESTSVRDIVDAAGVAKGTFYYYFDSKQAILEAVVDELIVHSATLIQEIASDPSLNATEKWKMALGAVGSWKADHKEELIALMRMMQSDENALLYYKVQNKTVETIAPELGKIALQGVEEGVFDTEFAESAAEIALSSSLTLSNSVTDLILNPQNYENPAAGLQQKVAAVQSAIERILGAEEGSLPMMDPDLAYVWFDKPGESAPEKML
jgi:AcrR family transcriptional regulator